MHGSVTTLRTNVRNARGRTSKVTIQITRTFGPHQPGVADKVGIEVPLLAERMHALPLSYRHKTGRTRTGDPAVGVERKLDTSGPRQTVHRDECRGQSGYRAPLLAERTHCSTAELPPEDGLDSNQRPMHSKTRYLRPTTHKKDNTKPEVFLRLTNLVVKERVELRTTRLQPVKFEKIRRGGRFRHTPPYERCAVRIRPSSTSACSAGDRSSRHDPPR